MTAINISVIIPVFNAERFIEKAVNSVLIQPEVDEILLIDDGSKDRSCEIIQRLASERDIIKVLTHPNRINKGPAATRNMGILKAKNEWIAFLDADDRYEPNRFKKDIELIEKNKMIDGVYNLSVREGNAGKKEIIGIIEDIPPDNLFFHISPIGNHGLLHANAILVRKTKIMEAGLFDENFRIGEDMLLYIKLSLIAKLTNSMLKEPVTFRTKHDQNTTNQIGENVHIYLYRIFDNLLKWQHPLKKKKHQNMFINKYIHFKANEKKLPLIKELTIQTIKYPYFMCSKHFFNYIKHLLKF